MAVQFNLPDEQVMNSVGVTSPIFFTRTPEVFTEMLDIAKSFKKGWTRLFDPILQFRHPVYAISFERRSREKQQKR